MSMKLLKLLIKKKQKSRKFSPHASLPKHIAIVLDGNGRWAAKRALPRTAGHAAGAETSVV